MTVLWYIYNMKTLTKKQIEFLNKYAKGSWSYDPQTGLVDVDGAFDCGKSRITTFSGVRFGKVSGYFNCSYNLLTSLKGAPQKVGAKFYCTHNLLTTLKGAPQEVGDSFYCERNNLTTLAGAPQKVGGAFSCERNQLTTLKGAPQEVESFYCFQNKLTSLVGAPQKVGWAFYCHTNRLTTLEGIPQKMGGWFGCDEFKLNGGEWNVNGWIQVLKKAKGHTIMRTLPYLTEDIIRLYELGLR